MTSAASMSKKPMSIFDRLEAASMPVTECGCWIWMGALSAYRYGTMRIDGQIVRAHRASWTAYRGAIPEGLHVLHRCDIGICINPDHLFLGTPLDNARDKETKQRGNHASGDRNGRHTKPCKTSRGENHYTRRVPLVKAGERNGRAVLRPDQIISIRAWSGSYRAAAREFGVSKTTIRKVVLRQLWKHL